MEEVEEDTKKVHQHLFCCSSQLESLAPLAATLSHRSMLSALRLLYSHIALARRLSSKRETAHSQPPFRLFHADMNLFPLEM